MLLRLDTLIASLPFVTALTTPFGFQQQEDNVRATGPRGARAEGVGRSRRPELLRRLCPKHLDGIRGNHTTSVAFSCSGELLATYGNEDIYLFDYTGRSRWEAAASAHRCRLPRALPSNSRSDDAE